MNNIFKCDHIYLVACSDVLKSVVFPEVPERRDDFFDVEKSDR